MANWEDRRKARAPRFPLLAPATIEKAFSRGRFQYGRAVNLSRGGLGLEAFGDLTTGTPVHVTVYLPGQSALTRAGWVTWADRPAPTGSGSAGVAFLVALDGDLVADIASKHSPPGQRLDN
jgi:PilZ domain